MKKQETKRNDKQGHGINLWAIVAILGLFFAVCIQDGTPNEVGLRAVGVLLFGTGACMGGWIDLNEPNENESESESAE